MTRKCHQTLKCHSRMVEVLGRNANCREFSIVLREEVDMPREEEEGNDDDEEEKITW